MLKRFKKKLRNLQTEAESALWYYLRDRRMEGLKFRRQHILREYIVDFICLKENLVIELDGGHHADQGAYDEARTRVLRREGFTVIRFWNDEVLYHIDDVLQSIRMVLRDHEKHCRCVSGTPHPPQKARRPLPQGER